MRLKKWFLWTLLPCGLAALCYAFLAFYMNQTAHPVTKIVQYAPQSLLEGVYMEEILALDAAHPPLWRNLSAARLTERLLACPAIEEGEVVKRWPDQIEVTYRLRRPCFAIYGSGGLVVDASGTIFPLAPFFTPRTLPYIVLNPAVDLKAAHRILALLGEQTVDLIDLSSEEEIIVRTREPEERYLRLDPTQIEDGLLRYRATMRAFDKVEVVDLRFTEIGLVYGSEKID